MIEYVIDYLKNHGITELVMLVSDKEAQLVQNQLSDGERFGVRVEYSVAERIGTAGALRAAEDLLGDRFVVYYGDILTNMDLGAMIQFHDSRESLCTLALSTSVPIEYGIARVEKDGRVVYFEEKPILKEYPVSMGIDILEREVLSYCEPNKDIAQDVIPRLLSEKKAVFAYLTEKRHYDIGTFKSLEEVRQLAENDGSIFR